MQSNGFPLFMNNNSNNNNVSIFNPFSWFFRNNNSNNSNSNRLNRNNNQGYNSLGANDGIRNQGNEVKLNKIITELIILLIS